MLTRVGCPPDQFLTAVGWRAAKRSANKQLRIRVKMRKKLGALAPGGSCLSDRHPSCLYPSCVFAALLTGAEGLRGWKCLLFHRQTSVEAVGAGIVACLRTGVFMIKPESLSEVIRKRHQ